MGLRIRRAIQSATDPSTSSRLTVFTVAFHTVRCAAVTIILAILSSFPLAQALVYLMCAIIGLGWDLRAIQHRSRLELGQTLCMDVTKLVAVAGFAVLLILAEPNKPSAWICQSEIVVLLSGIMSGAVLVAIQMRSAVSRRENEGKSQEMVRVATGPPSDLTLGQNVGKACESTIGRL